MWKKNENEADDQSGIQTAPVSPAPRTNPIQQLKERAVIGNSIVVKGDLSGTEDLEIHGSVDGTVLLKDNTVTIGREGRVKADIQGKVISVEGKVTGNLKAQDKVVVRKSGTVHGNIVAPRVTLEDGCKFTGSIDMESEQKGLASIAGKHNQPVKKAVI